jgi:hypothetical protein
MSPADIGYISSDSFRDKDGKLDWDRYEAVQVEHGDLCSRCRHFIIYPTGHRSLCNACSSLTTSKVEVRHDKFVRCPKCGKTWAPDCCDEGFLYEDGDHEVICDECDTRFTVKTNITFTFTSPGLLSDDGKEEDKDAGPDLEDPVSSF